MIFWTRQWPHSAYSLYQPSRCISSPHVYFRAPTYARVFLNMCPCLPTSLRLRNHTSSEKAPWRELYSHTFSCTNLSIAHLPFWHMWGSTTRNMSCVLWRRRKVCCYSCSATRLKFRRYGCILPCVRRWTTIHLSLLGARIVWFWSSLLLPCDLITRRVVADPLDWRDPTRCPHLKISNTEQGIKRRGHRMREKRTPYLPHTLFGSQEPGAQSHLPFHSRTTPPSVYFRFSSYFLPGVLSPIFIDGTF